MTLIHIAAETGDKYIVLVLIERTPGATSMTPNYQSSYNTCAYSLL